MVWLAVCNVLLAGSLFVNSKRWQKFKGIWLIAPSTIFCITLVLRIVVGSNLTAIMPASWVIEGEYDQYIVTWQYMSDISRIWAIYGGVAASSYLILWWVVKRARFIPVRADNIQRESGGWAKVLTTDSQKGIARVENRRIVQLTILIVLTFLASAAVEIYSGASDRGIGYSRWVNTDITPLLPFKIISRFSLIGYFLIPFASRSMKRWNKIFLWVSGSIWPVAGLYFGGRGQAMYPLLAVALGVLVRQGVNRKTLVKMIGILLAMMVAVPWIAAYRDSSVFYSGKAHTALGSRLSAFAEVLVSDRLGYRVKAIGREFYACSDGFLFTKRNKNRPHVGLEGLEVDSIGSIIKPSLLSKGKVVKNDASKIAQSLIGVDIAGWYPCITTPGDLYRRGGDQGLVLGGMAMGLVLVILDRLWRLAITSNVSTFTLLMSCISVSYVQLNLNGTVRELIWMIGWDLPKYVVIALLTDMTIRMIAKVRTKTKKVA